eukprot:8048196-Pyramimonas_sp.AAC.1
MNRDRHAYPAKQDNNLIFENKMRDAMPEYMIAPSENINTSVDIKINGMTYNVVSAREAEPTVKRNMTRAGRFTNEWRGPIMRRQLQYRG